jgi:hypothetical protein
MVGSRQYADNPSDRWHDHGDSRRQFGGEQHGPEPRVPNLYVAGPRIFTTSGASSPTYTIFALSARRRAAGRKLEFGQRLRRGIVLGRKPSPLIPR